MFSPVTPFLSSSHASLQAALPANRQTAPVSVNTPHARGIEFSRGRESAIRNSLTGCRALGATHRDERSPGGPSAVERGAEAGSIITRAQRGNMLLKQTTVNIAVFGALYALVYPILHSIVYSKDAWADDAHSKRVLNRITLAWGFSSALVVGLVKSALDRWPGKFEFKNKQTEFNAVLFYGLLGSITTLCASLYVKGQFAHIPERLDLPGQPTKSMDIVHALQAADIKALTRLMAAMISPPAVTYQIRDIVRAIRGDELKRGEKVKAAWNNWNVWNDGKLGLNKHSAKSYSETIYRAAIAGLVYAYVSKAHFLRDVPNPFVSGPAGAAVSMIASPFGELWAKDFLRNCFEKLFVVRQQVGNSSPSLEVEVQQAPATQLATVQFPRREEIQAPPGPEARDLSVERATGASDMGSRGGDTRALPKNAENQPDIIDAVSAAGKNQDAGAQMTTTPEPEILFGGLNPGIDEMIKNYMRDLAGGSQKNVQLSDADRIAEYLLALDVRLPKNRAG